MSRSQRLQVAGPSHEVDRVVAAVLAAGGALVARSVCEPSNEDYDDFGTGIEGVLAMAELAGERGVVCGAIDGLVAGLIDRHTVVVDLTRPSPQLRCLPMPGLGAAVVRGPGPRRRGASRHLMAADAVGALITGPNDSREEAHGQL